MIAFAVGKSIDWVRVNDVRTEEREGRRVWVKVRRPAMGAVIACGNVFMRRSRSRIQMFVRTAAWQAWELHSLRLLHGAGFACGPEGERGIWAEHLPGLRLRELLSKGELGDEALAAAGRELARSHGLRCPALGGGWSHGDLHLSNMLYDASAGAVRILDFETVHEADLGEVDRHADDLLVPLLDLLGLLPDERWPGAALVLLSAYGRGPAIARLLPRLRPPAGLEAVLWATRTSYLRRDVLVRRLAALAEVYPGLIASINDVDSVMKPNSCFT